jgi:trimeric autotransporter adhesin
LSLSFLRLKLVPVEGIRMKTFRVPGEQVSMRQNTLTYSVAILIFSIFSVFSAASQFSDSNWFSMGGLPGANATIYAAATDESGSIYVGGDFTVIGDVMAKRIAKWDGSKWSAPGAGLNWSVYAIATVGTNVYAGGRFPSSGTNVVNHVARWDGTQWSALDSGVNGHVYALLAFEGNLYVGGDFTAAGSQTANHIARWDGTAWSALGSGMNGSVRALGVYGDKLCAGGEFTQADGMTANRIAIWSGSGWSTLGAGLSSNVYSIASSANDLIVGGTFTNAGAAAAKSIARWDGVSWTNLGAGVQGAVNALAVIGNVLYVAGDYTRAGNSFGRNLIAKWNLTNSTWSSMTTSTMDRPIFALAVSGTNLYVGGDFSRASETVASYIVRWNGNSWSRLSCGFNAWVSALAVAGNDLYAGGSFLTAGNVQANYIAKWNGTEWSPLGSGLDGPVYALAVAGNDLYVGGAFTYAGTGIVNHIAKWTIGATNDSGWSPLGSGVWYDDVYALAVKDNYLYVGGGFTIVGASSGSRNYIVKWAIGGTNDSSWSSLGRGVSWDVYALAVKGNDLYVGGVFWEAGEVSGRNRVAKWTIGSTNNGGWSTLGTGLGFTNGTYYNNNAVHELAVAGDYVYAGGVFTNAGGVQVNYIAKWDGQTWSAVGSGVSYWVTGLASSGSDLYVGGSFTAAAGTARSIAKWDGRDWSALGSGITGSVGSLVCSGTNLYVGGFFSIAGDKVSAYVARAGMVPARGCFRNSGFTTSGFACTFADGTPGGRYRIQTSLSPMGPWTDFTNFTYSVPARITETVSTSNRYYRAVSP